MTVPDYNGTFTVADITVSLNITDANDSSLNAVLIAPDGTVGRLVLKRGEQRSELHVDRAR